MYSILMMLLKHNRGNREARIRARNYFEFLFDLLFLVIRVTEFSFNSSYCIYFSVTQNQFFFIVLTKKSCKLTRRQKPKISLASNNNPPDSLPAAIFVERVRSEL